MRADGVGQVPAGTCGGWSGRKSTCGTMYPVSGSAGSTAERTGVADAADPSVGWPGAGLLGGALQPAASSVASKAIRLRACMPTGVPSRPAGSGGLSTVAHHDRGLNISTATATANPEGSSPRTTLALSIAYRQLTWPEACPSFIADPIPNCRGQRAAPLAAGQDWALPQVVELLASRASSVVITIVRGVSRQRTPPPGSAHRSAAAVRRGPQRRTRVRSAGAQPDGR